ncbi:MAG: glycosyltransferase family 2 protein [Acidobacteriaceae bacterium]|nr:glycosyltransferase family 2 protein [Acidobacteriaceae bacterium]
MSTYNRCDLLDQDIAALLNQQAEGIEYEVILVDNNSTDKTAEKIAEYTRRDERIRYIFEGRQGVAYGRNAGIAAAHADLIAFCDDDVYVAPDWLRKMKQALDGHPDAEFVGGKVVPVWREAPPEWLTTTMGPLALQDYGDRPMRVSMENARCLVSACLGVRRRALERAGLFPLGTQRVKDSVGSSEDYEWELEVWKYGGYGVYVPDIVCYCEVPPSRLKKGYHRRWHLGHGKFNALARRRDFEGGRWRFLDVPAFVYRQILGAGFGTVAQSIRGNPAAAFEQENYLLFYFGFIRERWKAQLSRGRKLDSGSGAMDRT